MCDDTFDSPGITRLTIARLSGRATIPFGLLDGSSTLAWSPYAIGIITRNLGVVTSFADDLDSQRGIVRSRVALLLRSSEIQPLLTDVVIVERSQ